MLVLEKSVPCVPSACSEQWEVDTEHHDIQISTLLLIENGLPSGLLKEQCVYQFGRWRSPTQDSLPSMTL